jgi:hypothetical protein
MRLAVLAAAILVAAGLGSAYAAGALGGDSPPNTVAAGAAPPPPKATELAAIRQLVLESAAGMGDSHPTGAVLVPTTRRLAELVDVDTAESDTPVYFVLVHGEFKKSGSLLALTIDPATNTLLDTGLVGALPDVNAIGTPEPLSLSTGADLTKDVPCYDGRQPLVGPQTLRHFRAVTAVSCIDGTRTYPGQGEWSVRIRRVAVGSVAPLQRYFEQPSRPHWPKNAMCLDVLRWVLVPTFVDGAGHWLVPRTPVDACGSLPDNAQAARRIHWRIVSVKRVKLMVSAAALAAHCAMQIKDLPGGGIGPIPSTSGGPLFESLPKTLHVCVYRTPANDFEVGNFVRGFSLDASQTARLLGATTGAAPTGSCPSERTLAVIRAKPELWAEVELGGCFRVGRTYPEYGIGGSDPSVVGAVLGGS